MIHIWKLHIGDENQDPSLETSIVYNALGFCKFSLDEQQGGKIYDKDTSRQCYLYGT